MSCIKKQSFYLELFFFFGDFQFKMIRNIGKNLIEINLLILLILMNLLLFHFRSKSKLWPRGDLKERNCPSFAGRTDYLLYLERYFTRRMYSFTTKNRKKISTTYKKNLHIPISILSYILLSKSCPVFWSNLCELFL